MSDAVPLNSEHPLMWNPGAGTYADKPPIVECRKHIPCGEEWCDYECDVCGFVCREQMP